MDISKSTDWFLYDGHNIFKDTLFGLKRFLATEIPL